MKTGISLILFSTVFAATASVDASRISSALAAQIHGDESILNHVSVNFVRMHRRARANVHSPGHPNSDTIYRIGINSDGLSVDASADAVIKHILLKKLPDQVLIDSDGSSATRDILTIVDDDSTSLPPNFDGKYELTVTSSSNEVTVRQFSVSNMNSLTVPSLVSPEDCQLMSSDQPQYTWINSDAQGSDDGYNLQIKLVTHTGPWHEVMAKNLNPGTTAFSIATDAGSRFHLDHGTYRVFVTETFLHHSNDVILKRVSLAARAFVIGSEITCD